LIGHASPSLKRDLEREGTDMGLLIYAGRRCKPAKLIRLAYAKYITPKDAVGRMMISRRHKSHCETL